MWKLAKGIGFARSFAAAALVATWLGNQPSAFAEQRSTRGALASRTSPARPNASRPVRAAGADWKKTKGQYYLPLRKSADPGRPIDSGQLDALLDRERGPVTTQPAPEDQWVRRVYLDVIGELPAPADIKEYLSDPAPDKKARLIDRLLAMPQYGRNWGRYWSDVISYHATVATNLPSLFREQDWLADQFNRNVGWDKIVAEILTARGESTNTPQGFFIASMEAKPEELAGEAARVFLGVQIACAQCHDHPTESWKREQFHELASFFGRVIARRKKVDTAALPKKVAPIVFEVMEKPARREYRMPDLKNPSAPGKVVPPVFLAGQTIPLDAGDRERRAALASYVTSPRNPYFAKALVNRVWSELLGRGFVSPVDDLGPSREVTAPRTFEALAGSFTATHYDLKRLFRTILNSRVYAEAGSEPADDAPSFARVEPSRLSSDQVLDALDWVLGNIDDGVGVPYRGRQLTIRGLFKTAFGYDPSIDQKEVEGSILQALALMNHPRVHSRIEASTPDSLLDKLLRQNLSDDKMIEALYLRALARRPTAEEVTTCLDYLGQAPTKREAFEDVLWSLVNSTEFLYNH